MDPHVQGGAGNNFYYFFHNADDPTVQNTSNAAQSEGGVQFNLFGKAAAVPLPPTAPAPKSTTIHYHYDVAENEAKLEQKIRSSKNCSSSELRQETLP